MPKKDKKVFLVIDANSLLHRSYHALPPFTTGDGTVVNAVYGFVSTLLKSIKEFSPAYVAAAFDLEGPTFRHKAFEAYKGTREKADQDLYDQFPIMKDVLRALRIPIAEKKTYEADDIIGTIVGNPEPDTQYVILTSDMDALQLVNQQVSVYRLRKGVTDIVLFDEKGVEDKYGLSPEQIVDYKALRGDPSDNIPGVKGIGEKTAVQLLQTFKSLEGVYSAVKKNDPALKPSVKKKLIGHEKDAELSQQLARIVLDVPIDHASSSFAWDGVDYQTTKEIFQKLEFKSLLDRIPNPEKKSGPSKKVVGVNPDSKPLSSGSAVYTLINSEAQFEAFLSHLLRQKKIAVDTETTNIDPFQADILGASFSWKESEGWYCNLASHPEWLPRLKKVLEDPSVEKIGHNLKYDYHVLFGQGIDMRPLSFDTMIASYLIRPGLRQYNLDAMVFKELGYQMQPIEDLIGKGKDQISMKDVPLEKVSWYASEDAEKTFALAERLRPQLKEHEFEKLFTEIEMPLVSVLSGMERTGIAIDVPFLGCMEKDLAKKILSLEKKIYKTAGKEFNINSPLQLKEILFDRLGLSTEGLAKTKTGVSTAASELEKLQGQHEIIDYIMEYREFTKLQSTYVTALPKLLNPKTKRIHTSYNQTVAATGRLSSSDPNLQNIPIRTELGNEIRKAFVAGDGKMLLSVDYSQVELRIVASLAEDDKMIEAFQKGEDIHQRTAAYMFGVPLEEVTKEMRYSAKEVNFGVLYGMGAWGLSARRKISRKKAQEFIERYFSVYHGVYDFLQQIRVKAQEQGYVETLMGRKRYLPEMYSEMRQLRAQAERMAVNFPVQGTAADIMKIAMIEVDQKLPTISPESRMILQVHDELVFEVPEKEVAKVAQKVQSIMQGVAKLKVPLKAESAYGKSWGEMQEIF